MQIDTSSTANGGGSSWWDVLISICGSALTTMVGWWVHEDNGLHLYHAVGTVAGSATILFTLVRMIYWLRKKDYRP